MPGCAGCQHAAALPQSPALLFRIQRKLRAQWSGLELSVQIDSTQWTLTVRDEARSKTLYTAYRGSEGAARASATEFAISYVLGFGSQINPHQLASQLAWQEGF